jgi:hypothetical protein
MASRSNVSRMDAGLVKKGDAKPSGDLPKGTKDTTAITVRLDAKRYRKLLLLGAETVPKRTNQQIMVAALDEYLAKHTS